MGTSTVKKDGAETKRNAVTKRSRDKKRKARGNGGDPRQATAFFPPGAPVRKREQKERSSARRRCEGKRLHRYSQHLAAFPQRTLTKNPESPKKRPARKIGNTDKGLQNTGMHDGERRLVYEPLPKLGRLTALPSAGLVILFFGCSRFFFLFGSILAFFFLL